LTNATYTNDKCKTGKEANKNWLVDLKKDSKNKQYTIENN